MLDVLLINPGNRKEQFEKLSHLATVAQPLGIALLASFLRDNNISVKIIDAEAEFWTTDETINEIKKYKPRLIGISAFTTKMTSAGNILRAIKNSGIKTRTIVGGHHASAIPEITLQQEEVDFVCQGEGYYPVLDLINSIKSGSRLRYYDYPGLWYKSGKRIISNGMAPVNDLDLLPSPAWDLLPMNKYKAHHWQTWNSGMNQNGFAVLYTSLGCPFSCDFCSVNVVYGAHKQRLRSIDKVVEDIYNLVNKYNIKYIEIIDDTFTVNKKRVIELCKEIDYNGLGNKIHMWCFARANTMTKELAHNMKKAGIDWVFMGFESGSDEILGNVNKRQTIEQIKKAVDIARPEGLLVGGNYVFGLSGDTLNTMQQTLDLAKELNTEYANFYINMAYPGTKLYNEAKEKGYPLPKKWSQYGFFTPDAIPMRNENLDYPEILKFRDNAFNEYFTSEKYLNHIDEVFGSNVVKFIQTEITSKKIERVL